MTRRVLADLDAGGERNRCSALLPVLLLMFLITAIAIAAAVVVQMEVIVAERYRQSTEALHAADAAIEVVASELRQMDTWTPVLNGARRSVHSRGAFSGSKAVPGGGTVAVCCGPDSLSGRLAAETALSPSAARRLVTWQPFLWATVDSLAPRLPASRLFVVAFVGQDEEEAGLPGHGDSNETVLVRAEAVDPDGVRRTVEALVARRPAEPLDPGRPAQGGAPAAPVVGILRWHEVR